jgi:hypothetical protein
MDKIIHMPKSLEKAENLEDILCLSVLIANGTLPDNANLYDSLEHYKNVMEDCGSCPFCASCLACIINQ